MHSTHLADRMVTGVAFDMGQRGRCQIENRRGSCPLGGKEEWTAVVRQVGEKALDEEVETAAGRQAGSQIDPEWQKEPPCSPVGEQLP